jgi:hypothetical protein
MERNSLGRIIGFDAALRNARVLLRDLNYPGGLAVADGQLWFTESFGHRLSCAVISAAGSLGALQIVIRNMPGYPSRLALTSDGGFWLSLFGVRTHLVEFVLREDDFREEMMRTISKQYWVAPAELVEEPADDQTSSNFPPRPNFAPLITNSQREAVFGHYDYISAPEPGNPEAIRIFGTWQKDNILNVPIPQLRKALGANAPQTMQFHRLAASQLQGMWADWEKAKLIDRILIYDGSFVPRFVRGSRTILSNHAFGSAFDINARYNRLGQRPSLVGEKGSVRELIPIANEWGFWWGGHYSQRLDGMHIEVAFIK